VKVGNNDEKFPLWLEVEGFVRSPHEIGRAYTGGMLDITGAQDLEIQIAEAKSGQVIWINVDGMCALRVCRIKGKVTIERSTKK
jgi:hypothetical protein